MSLIFPDGEERHVGFRVADDEVGDAMTSGIQTGNETAPGNRTEGRHGGTEARKNAGFGEFLEVWCAAGVNEGLNHLRVQTVKTEDDDLLLGS